MCRSKCQLIILVDMLLTVCVSIKFLLIYDEFVEQLNGVESVENFLTTILINWRLENKNAF